MKSAFCTLSKYFLIAKERVSTPVLCPPWISSGPLVHWIFPKLTHVGPPGADNSLDLGVGLGVGVGLGLGLVGLDLLF